MATIVVRRLCKNSVRSYARSFSILRTKSDTIGPSLVFNVIRFNHNRVLVKRFTPSLHNLCAYSNEKKNDKEVLNQKKLGLFQKFKQMYRDYWYVLVPVHIVTSIGWFGSFYYMAKSGIDIVAIMENWHISETLISPLRDSSMGYIAVSYALYKLATPFRYMVTLGGTTFSINYLKNLGYIKPVPSAQELKVMYKRRMGKKKNVKNGGSGIKMKCEELTHLHQKETMVAGLDKKVKMECGGRTGKVKSIKKTEKK
nr:protein FAM210A-like isoform X1 [Onthophagus taurus]XP_022910468.1 protein FAM210A-like isoform X1 [Onthophagus taurus]